MSVAGELEGVAGGEDGVGEISSGRGGCCSIVWGGRVSSKEEHGTYAKIGGFGRRVGGEGEAFGEVVVVGGVFEGGMRGELSFVRGRHDVKRHVECKPAVL